MNEFSGKGGAEADPLISNKHAAETGPVNGQNSLLLVYRPLWRLIKSSRGLQTPLLCGQSKGLWVARGGRHGLINI